MQMFIQKPSIDLYAGVIVKRDTELEFDNGKVKQTLRDLVLHSVMTVEGEGYVSTMDTTVQLSEGDVLIFEEEGRGYIKPVVGFVTVEEAIRELEIIKP